MTFENHEFLKNKLNDLFKGNGVLDDNRPDLALHDHCKSRYVCWGRAGALKRAPVNYVSGENWNSIALPYIGKEYNNELMVIGLNQNHHGGYSSLYRLIDGEDGKNGVKQFLANGKRRINFGNDHKKYRGTVLFHRVAVYSNILLNNSFIEKPQELPSIYEKIVYLNAVKCSPKENNSSPEKNMYSECLNLFLLKEIEILSPKYILILGSELSNLIKCTFGFEKMKSFDKTMEYYEIIINGNCIKVFKIIHPTAPRGNDRALYNKLLKLKKEIM